MKKKKWYVAMATALLLAAGCSDDLDNGKNNTGAEEDGEKVYMTVNVSTVSQGTLTKADPTPSNPNSGGAGWGEDGNGSLGELSALRRVWYMMLIYSWCQQMKSLWGMAIS